jgi:hypothetical protein
MTIIFTPKSSHFSQQFPSGSSGVKFIPGQYNEMNPGVAASALRLARDILITIIKLIQPHLRKRGKLGLMK